MSNVYVLTVCDPVDNTTDIIAVYTNFADAAKDCVELEEKQEKEEPDTYFYYEISSFEIGHNRLLRA